MRIGRIGRIRWYAVMAIGCVVGAQRTRGQEIGADSAFDARVARPAYAASGPRVLFDEAHYNYHTATGRYKPFADLLRNDGYRITSNTQTFSSELLNGYAILVIANASGPPPRRFEPAFAEKEIEAVIRWVQAGGALLLIADHFPHGMAAARLGRAFGVDLRGGWLSDTAISVKDSEGGKYVANPGILVFSRANGLLLDHPITAGRDSSERVNRIMTFTGQSLGGPPGSSPLVRLTETAVDAVPLGPGSGSRQRERISASGRTQGVSLTFGRGRVVVLGEAGMLSAQITPEGQRFGMNVPGTDNRQFTLNVLHWLSGLLKGM